MIRKDDTYQMLQINKIIFRKHCKFFGQTKKIFYRILERILSWVFSLALRDLDT